MSRPRRTAATFHKIKWWLHCTLTALFYLFSRVFNVTVPPPSTLPQGWVDCSEPKRLLPLGEPVLSVCVCVWSTSRGSFVKCCPCCVFTVCVPGELALTNGWRVRKNARVSSMISRRGQNPPTDWSTASICLCVQIYKIPVQEHHPIIYFPSLTPVTMETLVDSYEKAFS